MILNPVVGGGGGAPIASAYVTIGNDATLTAERALTGTGNQIIVSDNGANSTVVLSTPQNIHTAATPQFARLGLGQAADTTYSLSTSAGVIIGATASFSSQFVCIKQPATAQGIGLQSSADDSLLFIQHLTTSSEFRLSASFNITGSYQPLSFWTSDTRRMTILANGRVGIGTATPVRTLDARGGSNFSFMEAAGANGLIITPDGSVTGEMAYGVRLQTGTNGENINIVADSSTGGTSSSVRLIYYNGAAFYAALQISNVAGGGATRGNLLLMQSGGNVGIGESTPTANLHVRNDANTSADTNIIRLQSLFGAGGTKAIAFHDGTTDVGRIGLKYDTVSQVDFVIEDLYNAGYQTATTAFTVKGNGSVGIGTTSPSAKLHIIGAASSTPNMILNVGQSANVGGFQIVSSGTEAPLSLNNVNTGGKEYQIVSTGGLSGSGQGKYIVYNLTDALVVFTATNTGLIGIGPGTTSPGAGLDIGSTTTAAQTFEQIRYTAGTIVAGTQTGLLIDLSTNNTPGAQVHTGLSIKIPATTGANTAGAGALVINSAATTARVMDILWGNTADGVLFYHGARAGLTLTGSIIGLELDFISNVTANGQRIRALLIELPSNAGNLSHAIQVDWRGTNGCSPLVGVIGITDNSASQNSSLTYFGANGNNSAVHSAQQVIGYLSLTGADGGATSSAFYADYRATAGASKAISRILVGGATTFTGPVTGFNIDFNTNVTASSNNLTGFYVNGPADAGSASPCFRADIRNTSGYAANSGVFQALYYASTILTGQTVGLEIEFSSNLTPGANAIRCINLTVGATTRADTAGEAAGLRISSTATRMRMIDCAVANTGAATGLWVLRYGTATTLTAAVTGLFVDMATNVTISGQAVYSAVLSGGGVEIGPATTSPGFNRLSMKGGTAVATTDWALTSGWGAGASISAVTGNDSRGTVTVSTSALDTPTLNPVITLTFKDGTFGTAPFTVVCMSDASTGTMGAASCSNTATALKITYDGTPTALTAATYIFRYFVVG